MLRNAYNEGLQAALVKFKLANAVMGYGPGAAMNSTQTAMPTAPAKPSLSPSAPVAGGIGKANVLG